MKYLISILAFLCICFSVLPKTHAATLACSNVAVPDGSVITQVSNTSDCPAPLATYQITEAAGVNYLAVCSNSVIPAA